MKHASLYLALLTSTLLLSACDKTPKTEATAAVAAKPTEATSVSVPSYSPTQFYATKSYMGNDINHKADALLVASDETGVFNLYKVSLDGKSWTALTQSTTESILPVGWFPQDDRVLYRADQGGNELHHLYVRELDGSVKD